VTTALRLPRPGIIALVVMAGFSGMVLAFRGIPDWRSCAVCTIVLVLAAAGSTLLNSVIEFSRDCRMARCNQRTRGIGMIGRRRVAATGVILLVLSLALAYRFLTPLSAVLILAAAVWYLTLYTLLHKKISPFGAVTGGVPGALPALIGYGAVDSAIGPDGLIVFLLILLWQPPHFWILAFRCREDYLAAGLPVLPTVMGEKYAKAAVFLYATSLLPVSLSLWGLGFCSVVYAACALILGLMFLAALYRLLVQRPDFHRAFQVTNWYLAGLLFILMVDVSFR
jgi:heme o synthase